MNIYYRILFHFYFSIKGFSSEAILHISLQMYKFLTKIVLSFDLVLFPIFRTLESVPERST